MHVIFLRYSLLLKIYMSSANNKIFKDLPVTLIKYLKTWIIVSLIHLQTVDLIDGPVLQKGLLFPNLLLSSTCIYHHAHSPHSKLPNSESVQSFLDAHSFYAITFFSICLRALGLMTLSLQFEVPGESIDYHFIETSIILWISSLYFYQYLPNKILL